MYEVEFYKLGEVDESLFTRVVMVSKYKGKWVYSRQKGRDTWEVPGGHIEKGETPFETASRELYEETGATQARIEPVCIYKISTHALLCYAEIEKLGKLPESEIEEVGFFEEQPKNLTYPDIHSRFFEKVNEYIGLKRK